MTGHVRRVVRCVVALVAGGLWWWAVVRLAFVPDAGAFEGAVAAGGWGLSLLPVHALPKARAVGVAGAPGHHGARRVRTRAVRAARELTGGLWGKITTAFTTAWRRRRSGGGSGPS
ncbi:hypothetical protein [Streptomyces beihaiensis]|uniref:Integral membrane protein n=1 Tax=Streptomyces beihaiensis TaxID=2984495 RepID=A0ABT3TVI7_9ACTN|nr:hypothetical protein [Streptomyces beihaiensis]MCX3060496.1 hypothetical protein [Streptomyces beihaiensis]